MRRYWRWIAAIALVLMAGSASAQAIAAMTVASVPTILVTAKDASGVSFRLPVGMLRLTLWNDRTVRVTPSATGAPAIGNGPAVSGAPVAWTMTEETGRFVIATPVLRVAVAKGDGSVRFRWQTVDRRA